MCVTLTLCVFSKIYFKNFFPKFFQYFFQKFLPKFFPKLRHTASTMVSLVPGLGSRKFATQVVYLSLASLGLVAANSRLHASFTFHVRNPNLVRFFQKFFQKFFQNFSNVFFKNFCQNFFQNCDTRLLQWYLFQKFFPKFFAKFFPKFFQYFFQKFFPKFFPKLRHTASTMVSLVPGLGSRKFATQVVYLSLASLGLVAANSRLHASFTFYVRNPNLVRFFQNFFPKFFPKIFQYFFQKFLPKFFPKLRHTASTMVSLVPWLGSRKLATQVVYLSLASLGLVAANSRLHASFTFYVRNPNLVRFFQKFFQKFFPKFFQYFFQKFLPKFFPKLRHTASTMVSLVPGLGSRKFATQVVYLSLASLGLVAANSRLHASFTFYVRNPNLVRFFQKFFQKFFPKFFAKFFPKFFQYFFQKFLPKFFPNFFPKFLPKNFFQNFCQTFFENFFQNFFQNFSNIFFKNFFRNFFQNCDGRLLQWYLWSLGLVAANSRLRLCTCPLRLWAW